MVRVLIISPALMKGGMERQLSLFFKKYDPAQISITLAVFKNKIAYTIPPEVKLVDLKKRYKIDIKFYYRLARLILKHDVVNSKLSGINEIAMVLCGLLGKSELILEIRSSGARMLPYLKKMSLIYKIFRQRWPVICNSKKAVSEVEKVLPSVVPITYIGNGINTQQFIKKNGSKQKDGPLILGFVGSFKPVKNIEYLFETIHKLNKELSYDIILEIVGSALDEVYYQKLLVLADTLRINHQIKWVGNVNDIENYYNHFDILVLPSHLEGTPNVLLEAMSCECFCLISDAANSDNFLEKDFVFNIQTVDSLVEKILRFSSLTEEGKEAIGKKNRAYIVRNFSVEEMVRRYTDVLTHSFLS